MNLANRPHAGLKYPRARKRRNSLLWAACALAASGAGPQVSEAPKIVVQTKQLQATGDSRAFAETAIGIFGTVDLVTGAFTQIDETARQSKAERLRDSA